MDVAIVGAGSAGLAAYQAAVKAGARAVLVEGGELGTMCARSGCMPSKLLIIAANTAHDAKHAARFGVHAAVEVKGDAVLARMRRERDRFVGHVLSSVEHIPRADLLRKRARFVAPLQLEVGDDRVVARAVVLATGSTAGVPEPLRVLGDRAITSAELFEWPTLPRSVVVLGCGLVGLELGQALHRLGVRVRVLGREGKLAFLNDPLVRDKTTEALAAELSLSTRAELRSSRRVGDGVEVTFEDAEGLHVEVFDFALIATGRTPNLDSLDLTASGLELDQNGVPRFDPTTRQCGASAVFIAGDVSSEMMVLHEAVRAGDLAGENAARFPNLRASVPPTPLRIAFTEPQLAAIGSSWEELQRRDTPPVIAEFSFEDQGRACIEGRARGYGRVYFEATSGRLLGAELSGPEVEHLAHLLAWSHQSQLTVHQLLQMPVYHPVLEEALRTAFKDAARAIEARGAA